MAARRDSDDGSAYLLQVRTDYGRLDKVSIDGIDRDGV